MSDNTNFFGGEGFLIFALLLLFMGNGGFGLGGNTNSRVATVEDLNAQTNASRIESMIQNNGNLTEMKFDGLTKGLADMGYTNLVNLNNVEKSLSSQIQALSSKIDADKIASLTAQVSELKTQNMFCGIPRISNYAYGVYPYSTNCGCNNI